MEVNGHMSLRITYSIETITPEQATLYLKNRATNRGTSKRKIDSYVGDIRKDGFVLTHQPVAFNANGALIDGQHRLMAVMRSGRPVEFTVARYHMDAPMTVFDAGITRSFKNVLQMKGVPYANDVAAAVKYLCYYDNGQLSFYQSTTYSNDDGLRILEKYDSIQESIKFCAVGQRVNKLPKSALAFVHCLGSRKFQYRDFVGDRLTANDFIQQVKEGAELSYDSPVHVLRQMFLGMPTRGKHIINSRHRLGLVIKAYNYFAVDKPMKLLKLGREYPVFGEVD